MKIATRNNLLMVGALAILLMGAFLLMGHDALAAATSSPVKEGLAQAGKEAYGTTNAIPFGTLVGQVIVTVINVTGIIFVILVLYGGVMYMTASGDEERVKKSKRLLTSAIIGLIITLAAYSIASFVVDQLSGLTTTAQSQ
jgi:amino acid transporter